MATTTHIKFGDGLDVTDEGAGVIRVDGRAGPAGSAGPQGPAGPNLINGSTPTPLTGLLKGNGTDIDVATPADVLAAAGLGKAAKVQHSIDQSIPDSTYTYLQFDTELFDFDGIYDPAAPTRLTAQTAGLYLCFGAVQFEANATGARWARFIANSVNDLGGLTLVSTGAYVDPVLSFAGLEYLNPGQYIEVNVWQNSGVPLNVKKVSASSATFSIVRIG